MTNRNNNVFEILIKIIKKVLPYVFAINFLFFWGIIFIFFYENFNNILGYILCIISISISSYSHIIAADYLENKYNKKDDQN